MDASKELLKGTLSTIILRILHSQGKMYGYELTQHVKELTGGKLLIKEGSLYPALHRLEAEGQIVSELVYIGKRIRKYYSLTPKGKKTVQKAVSELLEFLDMIEQLITTNPRYGTT
jgi:PadR family transcriptional regulator, regulatory protein PadR